jgi:Ca-activated chloride channel family protein
LKPNRLERAKLQLGELSRKLEGDRIGLIVFAGDAVIKCPLTANYSYFRSVLGTVDSRSASVGGTRIGDAIRKALSDLLGLERPDDRPAADRGVQPGETVLEEELRGEKQVHADILLITDGEDHDSYPEKAAEKAARLGVGIYAVGIGSEQGTRIQVPSKKGGSEFLRHEGQDVYSKLNSRTLENMVNAAPRGRYLPAGTNNFDLVDLYRNTIAGQEGQDVVDEQVAWTEIFQPFLITGLCLYLLYLFIPERPRRGQLMALEPASAGPSGPAGDDVRAAAVEETKT